MTAASRDPAVDDYLRAVPDAGKGAIRYRRPDDVDLDVVRFMLRATASSTGPIC